MNRCRTCGKRIENYPAECRTCGAARKWARNAKARTLVVVLEYASTVDPVISFLRIMCPRVAFTKAHEPIGTFGGSWAIYASGAFEPSEIDRMRAIGVTFRDGLHRGYAMQAGGK